MAITRKKLLECQNCKKQTDTGQSSNDPAKSSGEKDDTLRCKLCQKVFFQRSNLLCHQRTHGQSATQREGTISSYTCTNSMLQSATSKHPLQDNSDTNENSTSYYSSKTSSSSLSDTLREHYRIQPASSCSSDKTMKSQSSSNSAMTSERTSQIPSSLRYSKRIMMKRNKTSGRTMSDNMKKPQNPHTADDQRPKQQNVFHRTLRNNWSKLVTDKITVMAFVRALKGHQCNPCTLSQCKS